MASGRERERERECWSATERRVRQHTSYVRPGGCRPGTDSLGSAAPPNTDMCELYSGLFLKPFHGAVSRGICTRGDIHTHPGRPQRKPGGRCLSVSEVEEDSGSSRGLSTPVKHTQYGCRPDAQPWCQHQQPTEQQRRVQGMAVHRTTIAHNGRDGEEGRESYTMEAIIQHGARHCEGWHGTHRL